jgi:hypothetical protein
MKLKLIFQGAFLAFLIVCLSSCSPKLVKYCQVLTMDSEEMETSAENALFYRDAEVEITYTFTDNTIQFLVQNLTDKDITVDLSRSFLCINGIAFDYYQDKTFWNAAGSSFSSQSVIHNSTTRINSSGTAYSYWAYNPIGGTYNENYKSNTRSTYNGSTNSYSTCNFDADAVSYKPKPLSIIPGGCGKFFCEFPVLSFRYTNEKLTEYPTEFISFQFPKKSASPYVFLNRIMLICDGVDKPIGNEFFVSQITNYHQDSMRQIVAYQTTETALGPVKEPIYAPISSINTPNHVLIYYQRCE